MSEPIVRVAARGDGVTQSGRHAALAAPGDTLTDGGEVVPGPRHHPPRCPHFPTCGGCQLQHLENGDYLAFVADRVTHALAAQGLATEVRPPLLSPPRSRRRARLGALVQGKRVRLGFNAGRSHRIVDMTDCAILHPALFALVAPLRPLLARFGQPRRRIEVGLVLVDQGPTVSLDGVDWHGLEAADALSAFAREHGLARLSVEEDGAPIALLEPEPATVTLSGVPVPLPHHAFLQATREGEAALAAAVRGAVDGAARIADLFAGLGTFALALAPDASVRAVEAERDPLAALDAAARGLGLPVRTEHRDLYRRPLTAAELAGFDAVVLDPPRAGAERQVAELAASTVPTVAYVSCNPASFARDAAVLAAAGRRLEWVRPVGQFLWSTHVELVGRFAR